MGWDDWKYHRLRRSERRTGIIDGYQSFKEDRGALRLLVNDDQDVPDENAAARFCRQYLSIDDPKCPDGCPTGRPVHIFFTSSFELARQLNEPRYAEHFFFDGIIQDIIDDSTGEETGTNNIFRIRQGVLTPTPVVLVVTNDSDWAQKTRAHRLSASVLAVVKNPNPATRSEEEAEEIREFFRRAEERRDLSDSPLFEGYRRIIGNQTLAQIQEFLGFLDDKPGQRLPVVILGKSGTGKEAVARLIHLQDRVLSDPSLERFQPVLVAGIPPGVLEGELFGVEGVYPQDRKLGEPIRGYIARAEHGTLFIDELGDVPTNVQGKLLRFLQERKIRPVGGEWREVEDVRCVFATHKNLRDPSEADLREDFLHRIDGLTLDLPELKDRVSEHEDLVDYFIGCAGACEKAERDDPFSPQLRGRLIELCRSGALTGNVRQLQMLINRIVRVAARGRQMDLPDLERAIKHSLARPVLDNL